MKKSIILLAALLIGGVSHAQILNGLTGGAQTQRSSVSRSANTQNVITPNVIEVQRFKQWGHKYLTVTNNWDGLFMEVISGEMPPVMSLVTAVNGESAESMTPDMFGKKISQKGNITIDYIEKDNGINHVKQVVFKAKNYYLSGLRKEAPGTKPATINLVSDSDIDFFDYNTYDFILEGDDKLTDKEIYETLAASFENRGLKRSTENPDLVFKMQKDFRQNSNSTYVPETSHIVNTGATTSSWKDKKGNIHVNTYQNNQVVKTGGYTRTTNTSSLHVLFVAFDGKKYRENPESMPIVWKLDYNSFFDSFVDMMGVMKTSVSYWCNSYPFAEQKFSYNIKSQGVAFRSFDDQPTGEIFDVLKGSDAYNKGLRAGDKILRIYKGGAYWFFWWQGKSTYFKADSFKEKRRSWVMPGYGVIIPIPFPRKVTQHYYNYLSKDIGNNNMNSKPLHYEIMDSSGNKYEIRSRGFELSNYSYEYIY